MKLENNRELDRSPEWLAIPAAAERLGISIESLRKRISRGQVRAHKDGSRWYIQVSGDADFPPPISRLAGKTNGPDTSLRRAHVRAQPVDQDPSTPWQEALLRRDQNLAQRDKEIERLTMLVADSQETIRNLVAAAIAEGTSRGDQSGALRTERARRVAAETEISLLRIYVRSLEEALRSRLAIGDREGT